MPQDIDLDAQMNFDDGTYAIFGEIITNLEDKDEEGNKIIVNEFHCNPTERVRIKHDIDEDNDKDYDNSSGWFKKRYPAKWCICLDPSPNRQVWRILCDWNGKYINSSDIKIKELTIDNENLVAENNKLDIEVATLQIAQKKMLENPKQFFKDVYDIIPQVKVVEKDEEKEGQETGE